MIGKNAELCLAVIYQVKHIPLSDLQITVSEVSVAIVMLWFNLESKTTVHNEPCVDAWGPLADSI